MDFDSMSMSELKQMSERKGYDTSGKDRVDLIMICKGYAELVKARPLEEVKEQKRQNRAAIARREREEKEAASKVGNSLIEEESLRRNSYLQSQKIRDQKRVNNRVVEPHLPFRSKDYDTMNTEGLIQEAQSMGFSTYQRDRTDLIMMCKGYGDAVNAKKATPEQQQQQQQQQIQPRGVMLGAIDYDMISINELKQMANEKGFDTYQKDRTDLIMIAKGYANSARAKPLNDSTWRSENTARSMPGNGMHLSGSSNFRSVPTTSDGASTTTDASVTASFSSPSFITLPSVPPRPPPSTPAPAAPSFPAAPSYATPSVPAAPSYTTPSFPAAPSYATPSAPAAPSYATPSVPAAPFKSDAERHTELDRLHKLMTDLDSLTMAQAQRLITEYDASYAQDKDKLKQAVIDVYTWEVNMHAERLATMQTIIQHMSTTTGTTKSSTADIQNLKNDIVRNSTPATQPQPPYRL